MASTTACAPNSSLSSVMSLGRRTAAVFTLTLSAPDIRILRASATDRMPPPTVSGMKTSPRGARHNIRHDVARVAGRRDVEKHQFVRALVVIALGEFHRIARVAQVDEVDAFDHAAAGDIETGNDALGQHCYSSTKLRTICNPSGPDFSG